MKITALVENTGREGLKTAHGLSFYIEIADRRILFDLGPDETLLENSRALGIDLKTVDAVILSHGHYDHGGGLQAFLSVNSTARIYLQQGAFLPHFSHAPIPDRPIGLDPALQQHPQLVFLQGDAVLSPRLRLLTVREEGILRSPSNATLYENDAPDRFLHEQSLLLQEGDTRVVLCGCSHSGIVNILHTAAAYAPQICIGGFHLCWPGSGESVPEPFLQAVAKELAARDMDYYTCHCTGMAAFDYLRRRLPRLQYFSAGMTLEL